MFTVNWLDFLEYVSQQQPEFDMFPGNSMPVSVRLVLENQKLISSQLNPPPPNFFLLRLSLIMVKILPRGIHMLTRPSEQKCADKLWELVKCTT